MREALSGTACPGQAQPSPLGPGKGHKPRSYHRPGDSGHSSPPGPPPYRLLSRSPLTVKSLAHCLLRKCIPECYIGAHSWTPEGVPLPATVGCSNEFEETQAGGEGQESLACRSPWGHKESERLRLSDEAATVGTRLFSRWA